MGHHKLLILLFIFPGLIIACQRDLEIEFYEQMSPISEASLPKQGKVNETMVFEVRHLVYNGCGQYSRNETVVREREIFNTFFAKYPRHMVCTDDIPERKTDYVFTPSIAGIYTLHFRQGEGEYMTGEIEIN